MLSKRTIIGLVVGSIIIGIGGYSLITHIGLITIHENYIVDIGDSTVYTIPAPDGTKQYMEIRGDSFDLELESPGLGQGINEGLQIPKSSFKDRLEEPLAMEWIHLLDGNTIIRIQNTGNTELEITGTLIRTSDPIWFTFDLMVIISGMVIIGFSMGFTLRKPKGF
ncbi:hypothetical protein [Nitrosopumilus sp. S6]